MNQSSAFSSFQQAASAAQAGSLQALSLDILQVNLGLLCNQVCQHCHLEAGPRRTESMSLDTLEALLQWAKAVSPKVVDLTGGAPELYPHLRRAVEGFSALGARVQARTNFTAFLEPPAQGLIEFYAQHQVGLVGSLPCYLEENVDRQRGAGVFEKSLVALRRLNQAGYGVVKELPLTLVYNPGGPSLPPAQAALEEAYKKHLGESYGLHFHHLIVIANMPLGHFERKLAREGKLEAYQQLLRENFNPATLPGIMCRHQVQVDWRGRLSDCDFNMILDLPVALPETHFSKVPPEQLLQRQIVTAAHCFGCTAGAGSSCSGELAG